MTLPHGLLSLGAELWLSDESEADVTSIPVDERTQLHDARRPLDPTSLARRLADHEEKSELPCGNSKPVAYLDLRHLSRSRLATCESALGVIERVLGVDPRHEPIPVCPGVADSSGGLWVDLEVGPSRHLVDSPRSFSTSLEGLYAAGSAAACPEAHLGRTPLLAPAVHRTTGGDRGGGVCRTDLAGKARAPGRRSQLAVRAAGNPHILPGQRAGAGA